MQRILRCTGFGGMVALAYFSGISASALEADYFKLHKNWAVVCWSDPFDIKPMDCSARSLAQPEQQSSALLNVSHRASDSFDFNLFIDVSEPASNFALLLRVDKQEIHSIIALAIPIEHPEYRWGVIMVPPLIGGWEGIVEELLSGQIVYLRYMTEKESTVDLEFSLSGFSQALEDAVEREKAGKE